MLSFQSLYNKVLSNEVSKESFLYEARRDVRFSKFVTNTMGFDNVVSAMKGKGIIWENTTVSEEDTFDFKNSFNSISEATKKPKKVQGDFQPYEFDKGWRVELKSTNDIEKAKEKVIDNLTKDPLFYTNLEMSDFVDSKKTKRTDLPIEVKKDNYVDKANAMVTVKGYKKPEKDSTKRIDPKASKKPAGVKVLPGAPGDMVKKNINESVDSSILADIIYSLAGVATVAGYFWYGAIKPSMDALDGKTRLEVEIEAIQKCIDKGKFDKAGDIYGYSPVQDEIAKHFESNPNFQKVIDANKKNNNVHSVDIDESTDTEKLSIDKLENRYLKPLSKFLNDKGYRDADDSSVYFEADIPVSVFEAYKKDPKRVLQATAKLMNLPADKFAYSNKNGDDVLFGNTHGLDIDINLISLEQDGKIYINIIFRKEDNSKPDINMNEGIPIKKTESLPKYNPKHTTYIIKKFDGKYKLVHGYIDNEDAATFLNQNASKGFEKKTKVEVNNLGLDPQKGQSWYSGIKEEKQSNPNKKEISFTISKNNEKIRISDVSVSRISKSSGGKYDYQISLNTKDETTSQEKSAGSLFINKNEEGEIETTYNLAGVNCKVLDLDKQGDSIIKKLYSTEPKQEPKNKEEQLAEAVTKVFISQLKEFVNLPKPGPVQKFKELVRELQSFTKEDLESEDPYKKELATEKYNKLKDYMNLISSNIKQLDPKQQEQFNTIKKSLDENAAIDRITSWSTMQPKDLVIDISKDYKTMPINSVLLPKAAEALAKCLDEPGANDLFLRVNDRLHNKK